VALLLASWTVDYNLKLALQRRVLAGEGGVHLALHLLEVASWLPGVLLLASLAAVLRRARPAVSPTA
jgi:hypothetical protein